MSTYQVRSLEEADQIIREHERKTKTTYALLRSTKNFGCVDVPACANDENEVRFETVGVPYCGVPFFVAGLKILQCQSYRVRGGRKKKEIKIEPAFLQLTGSGAGVIGEAGVGDAGGDDDGDSLQPKPMVKKKKKAGRTHKVSCTATIIMKEVIYYPEFQLFEHSKNNRIAVARQLKDALKSKAPVQKDRIIYVTVPAMSDHFGHTVGLGTSKQQGGKRLFVKNDFYGHNEPGSSKRVYYPVKQEKLNVAQLAKRMKVDEDDTEARAREVREILQSIMGLTYKQPGTTEAYRELHKDLSHARLKYQQTMDTLLGGTPITQIHVVEGLVNHNGDALEPVPQPNTGEETWPVTRATVVTTATAGNVSLAGSVSSPTTTTTTIAAVPQDQQQTSAAAAPTTATTDGNNQETSIFIEAMEAILNSQM